MSDEFGSRYRGRRVLVTGHTGFKGSWLCLWLNRLGAEVAGFSSGEPSQPNHFKLVGLSDAIADKRGDIRDFEAVRGAFHAHRPEIVFHLAAQSLVRRASIDPRETFEVNVMGTVNVLEAARGSPATRVVLVATSDKSYRNVGWDWPYREDDPLGGHEPYAGSKACAEIVTEVYQRESFQAHAAQPSQVAVASTRAGNVIGGGDWAADRLIPDIVRAIEARHDVFIRYPHATRPWQHVLDCLSGYLQLADSLVREPETYGGAWNFGPNDPQDYPVARLVSLMLERWSGHATSLMIQPGPPGKEAMTLRVDSSKAARRLGWRPVWNTQAAVEATIDWYRAHAASPLSDISHVSLGQIERFSARARDLGLAWTAP